MTFKVKVYTNSTWYDVSSYIDAGGDIPYISRNIDFTPRVEVLELEIAQTAADINADVGTMELGDLVKITDSSDNFLWGGTITELKPNWENYTYQLTVTNTLDKLKGTNFGYDEMHTLFATGLSSQYWTDFGGFNSVLMTWALQCAFSANGLTLNEGTVYSTGLFNKTSKTGWAGKQINYGNLYFDEYQLYCLKLSTACDPATAISEYVTRVDNPVSAQVTTSIIYKGNHEPELNCKDFVEETLTALKLALKQTDMNAYTLLVATGNYTIAQNDRYKYEPTTIAAQYVDPGISSADVGLAGDVWAITSSPRAKYYAATETKLNEFKLGGKETISIMKNFTVYFADADDLVSATFNESASVMELSSTLAIGTGTSSARLNIAAARYKATSATRTREIYTCPHQSTHYTVIENFLCMNQKQRHSRIVQES